MLCAEGKDVQRASRGSVKRGPRQAHINGSVSISEGFEIVMVSKRITTIEAIVVSSPVSNLTTQSPDAKSKVHNRGKKRPIQC